MILFNYIKDIVVGLYRLCQGMYITMLNMLRPKVTEQYPENRGKRFNPENFRGELVMPHDENNRHKCTACGICMMNCPNGTIRVISKMVTDSTEGKERKVLDKHMYDLGSCTFCAICTQTCPQDAIAWTNAFEHSLFTRDKLYKQLMPKVPCWLKKTKYDMEISANIIVFYILAAIITTSSILAVTSKRMLRAATYLLFVLIGTAGLYLMLNYHFLAAVQLSVYAGGILILFIFAILLTSAKGDRTEPDDRRRSIVALVVVIAGTVVTTLATVKHKFMFFENPTILGDHQIDMKDIGYAMVGTDKYQYLLPFEALSILLLSCIIGGILIARKR